MEDVSIGAMRPGVAGENTEIGQVVSEIMAGRIDHEQGSPASRLGLAGNIKP